MRVLPDGNDDAVDLQSEGREKVALFLKNPFLTLQNSKFVVFYNKAVGIAEETFGVFYFRLLVERTVEYRAGNAISRGQIFLRQ